MLALQGQRQLLLPFVSFVFINLFTCDIAPDGISALVACCLITLNKNLEVRPIGISDTVQRIIGR